MISQTPGERTWVKFLDHMTRLRPRHYSNLLGTNGTCKDHQQGVIQVPLNPTKTQKLRKVIISGIIVNINLSMCVCMLSHFSGNWLCNPMDCSPPGSSVHGILQARIPEWVAMPSSRGSSQPRDWTWTCGSYVACVGRQVLYHWHHLGNPNPSMNWAKLLQLCPTLRDPMDYSPPGAHQAPVSMRVLLARIIEWVAIFSSGDLPKIGIEPRSHKFPALAGKFFTTSTTWDVPKYSSGQNSTIFPIVPTLYSPNSKSISIVMWMWDKLTMEALYTKGAP